MIDLWRGCGLTWLKSCFAAQETLTLRRTSLLLCLGSGLMCVHYGWSKIGGFFSKKQALHVVHASYRSLRSIHHAFEHPKVGMLLAVIDVHVPKGVPEQV